MATRAEDGRFAPPPPGTRAEQTGEQAPNNGRYPHIPPYLETAMTLGLMLLPNGGTWQNPLAFPGYGQLYTGTYSTYRWMLNHPIVRLVRSIRNGIIWANTWEYAKVFEDDDVPDEWLKWTKKTFDPLRHSLVRDGFGRGCDHGWACGEPIWEPDSGRYLLRRVKPLLQDSSEVMRDPGGNPVAIRNYVNRGDTGPGYVDLQLPYKGFHWAYDSEAGYVYGRSWLENLRTTAWKQWLDCAQRLSRIGAKISGTVTIITSPAGTFPGPPDATGKPTQVSFRSNAEAVIKALANGAAGAWFPSLGLNPDGKAGLDAMKVLSQLIGKSMTNVEVKDFSGNSSGITSTLEEMKHAEELMFAGGLRSARTGLESEHGSRADAGEHTNTGTFNAESDDEEFAAAMQPLVDANLMLNFTPKARGRVRIKPPSLVDRKTSIYKAMLLGMINDPDVVAHLASIPGLMDSLLAVLDVNASGKFDTASFKKAADERRQPKPTANPKTPEPQGGRPPQE